MSRQGLKNYELLLNTRKHIDFSLITVISRTLKSVHWPYLKTSIVKIVKIVIIKNFEIK